jgi:hypothetical protein
MRFSPHVAVILASALSFAAVGCGSVSEDDLEVVEVDEGSSSDAIEAEQTGGPAAEQAGGGEGRKKHKHKHGKGEKHRHRFAHLDAKDGAVDDAITIAGLPNPCPHLTERLAAMDGDKDGVVSRDEAEAFRAAKKTR